MAFAEERSDKGGDEDGVRGSGYHGPAIPRNAPADDRSSSLTASIDSVTWMELFYDLVMVAAIIVFSHAVSVHPNWSTALRAAALFSVLWWVWLTTTLLVNADPSDDAARRGLIFVQMTIIVVLTIVGSHTEVVRGTALAPLIGASLLVVAALHEVARRTRPALASYARRRRDAFATSGAIVASTAWLPTRWAAVAWALAAVLMTMPVLTDRFNRGVDLPTRNLKHLTERIAALTTIVLGEAFIRVALTGAGRHLYEINFLILCLEFVVVFSVWIAYFDGIARLGLPFTRRAQRWWLVSHLPLHLGIVGTAVGLGAIVTLRASAQLTDVDIWVLTAPLALSFVAIGTIGLVAPRVPRGALFAARLGAAALLVVVAEVTWWSAAVTLQEGVAGFGLVTVAYVVVARHLLRRTTPAPVTS